MQYGCMHIKVFTFQMFSVLGRLITKSICSNSKLHDKKLWLAKQSITLHILGNNQITFRLVLIKLVYRIDLNKLIMNHM